VKSKSLAVLCLVLTFSLAAESRRDVRGNYTADEISRYVSVEVAALRTAFGAGEKIPVRYRVRNSGYRKLRFFPHENMTRTFQFHLEDANGREIQPLPMNLDEEEPVRDLQGNGVREIILAPGETFEKSIDLSSQYRLEPGREYRLCAYFVPDQEQNLTIRSRGWLRLRMEKSRHLETAYGDENPAGAATGLSPEETVYLFLSAELKKNWPNYLKYLDLPRFVTSYDRFALRYASSSDLARPGVLGEFSSYLTSRNADILKRFKILRTDYARSADGETMERGNAKVTVVADRDDQGFRVRYEYVYTLAPAEDRGFWKIIHVQARVVRQGQNRSEALR
jgi:hypothetical protein